MSENTESSARLHRDGYDDYRMAGELFGRLQEAIEFGNLTMWQNVTAVSFVWEFIVTNSASVPSQKYACQWNVILSEFRFMQSLENEAAEIMERWTECHRKVTS
jgi:hypothetical protein